VGRRAVADKGGVAGQAKARPRAQKAQLQLQQLFGRQAAAATRTCNMQHTHTHRAYKFLEHTYSRGFW